MSSDATPSLPGQRCDTAGAAAALVPAFTLVVWVACVGVGLAGLLGRPPVPPGPVPTSQPAVQLVSVELDSTPPPSPDGPTAASAADAAPAADAAEPVLPSIPTAALPSPAIAFAVPVAGPARVGPAARAVPAGRSSGSAVQRIAYGVGVGRQPKPDYPEDARDAGQQGVVTVRMSIAEDGRVTRAWVAAASPFPSLNQAALAAVRDTWHFAAGPSRAYEVPITFRLNEG